MRGCARRATTPSPATPWPLSLLVPLLVAAAGCSTTRTFTIYTKPPDAKLIIDGVERGTGPLTQRFEFNGRNDIRYVTARREGYKAATEGISATTPHNTVVIELQSAGPRVLLSVEPEPAVLKVDGVPVSPRAVERWELALDQGDPRREYVITAENPRYETAVLRLKATDPPGYRQLRMRALATQAMQDPALARQTPPGANGQVSVRPLAATRPAPVAQAPVAQPPDPRPVGQPPTPQPGPPQAAPQPAAPLKRDVAIRTDPPNVGAEIEIDGVPFGKNGATITRHEFKRDAGGKPLPQTVTATAPGFEGGKVVMRWEDNRKEYTVPLGNRAKTVRITTVPPDAVVTINDKPVTRGSGGRHEARLTFPPDRSVTYVARAAPPAGKAGWEPDEVRIGWDNGQTDYRVELRQTTIVKVPLVSAVPAWTEEDGWRVEPKRTETLAARDTSEPGSPETPRRLGDFGPDAMVDAVAMSRDGSYVLYTLLSLTPEGHLKSRMRLLNGDGSPGPPLPSDGRFADLAPSFTPDGGRIIFTSDREPGLLDVWQLTVGLPGGEVKPMARGVNAALWPTLDSSPNARLFYECVLRPGQAGAGGSEVRMVEDLDAPAPRMTPLSEGSRPRVSPRADSVVFTVADPKTGNRDLYLVADDNGEPLAGDPVNVTNTPDVDEYDPAWSRNGTRIVFASNAGADETGRRNYDIWWIPVTGDGAPEKPVRVTKNGSWDDSPAWDPAGKHVTFRSNRGGQWGIWRVPIAD